MRDDTFTIDSGTHIQQKEHTGFYSLKILLRLSRFPTSKDYRKIHYRMIPHRKILCFKSNLKSYLVRISISERLYLAQSLGFENAV